MRHSFTLPPAPGTFIQAGGLKLHYIEDGDASLPPLVCLHGLLASTDAWEKARPILRQRHHLFLLDLPGHGYSEKSDSFSMQLPDVARVVAAFIEALGLTGVTLAGQSMGGGISLLVAAHHGERLSKLVVIDPVSYPFKMPIKGKLGALPILGKIIVTKIYNRALLADFMRHDVYLDPALATDHEIDMMYAHFNSKVAKRGIHRAILAVDDPGFMAPSYAKIEVPTLILWGQNDKLIPASLGPRLAGDIKRSKLVLVENCGHLMMNEKTDVFCREVLAFTAN